MDGGAIAGLARPAPAEPELRWVGAQHLMHGYCGRAGVAAGAAGIAAGVGVPAGARAYAVRPTALLESRRHLVVRIGPRQGSSTGGAGCPAGETGEGLGETRARAA